MRGKCFNNVIGLTEERGVIMKRKGSVILVGLLTTAMFMGILNGGISALWRSAGILMVALFGGGRNVITYFLP